MDKIYCISGMGADHRIFKNLSISNYQLCPIPWVPFDKQDTLPVYAQKISHQIPGISPIILGLSYGGMLATEIGKIRDTQKIFLLSSAKTSAQLPWGSSLSFTQKLIDMIPRRVFEKPSFIGPILAGAKNENERVLLRTMMKDTPPGFIRWALKAVTGWNNTAYPPNIVQIHGTADKIIPYSNVHPDHSIKGGTHIMAYNRAAEVSKIIADCLVG
jgi:hypothetical protein